MFHQFVVSNRSKTKNQDRNVICIDKVTSPIKTQPGNLWNKAKPLQTLKDLLFWECCMRQSQISNETTRLNQKYVHRPKFKWYPINMVSFYLSNTWVNISINLTASQYNLGQTNYICCGKGNIPRRLVGLTRLRTDQLLSPFKVSCTQVHTGCIPGHMAPWGLRLCPPVGLRRLFFFFFFFGTYYSCSVL